MSNFPTVSDTVLRTNLDIAFDHIVDLLTLSESKQYKGKILLVSSLRKTIIIHTASIVEALLLYLLKNHCEKENIEITSEWKYIDIKIHYKIDESKEVIGGIRKKEPKSIDKLDFLRITDYCHKYKIINSIKLKEDIDKVREFRNRIHIGSHITLEKQYNEADLEFCFNVAKRVKEISAKLNN